MQNQVTDTDYRLEASRNASAAIGWIGIPTRNRPAMLSRAVASYVENTKCVGRDIRFVVSDDSDSEQLRKDNVRQLCSIKATYGVDIVYAGWQEKREFANAMWLSGALPRDVIEFALFGIAGLNTSPGACSNGLLLHTVGDMLLSVDDDTICRVAAVPGSDAEVEGDFGL